MKLTALLADKLRDIDPKRLAFFVTARGVTNEVYYVAQKVARFLGTNNVENAARLCHSPSTAAMKAAIGVAATTCSYKDFYGTDLIVFFGCQPGQRPTGDDQIPARGQESSAQKSRS